MENNSDKELRDKLRGIEAPFDPQAWEQMEAMLEKKRKPKAFIWWWTGGIAACLMLGAGIFGYLHFTGNNRTDSAIAEVESKQGNSPSKAPTLKEIKTNSERTIQTSANTQLHTTNATITNVKQAKRNANEVTETNIQSANYKATALNNKQHAERSSSSNTGSSVSLSNKKQAGNPVSLKTRKESKDNTATNTEMSAQSNVAGTSGIGQFNTTALAEGISDFLARRVKEELSSGVGPMVLMGPHPLISNEENEENSMKKKGEEAVDLKKLKKKLLFNYSLGVAANITGTTFGDHKMSPLFYKTPSYMVGITEDFMFLKRIAITTGIMFSQTSFSDETFAYTCKITELNIPIGLKGYIISKQKIRFYIGTGIINHIKLKEKFTPLDVDPQPNILANYVPSNLGITSNSFSGQYQSQIGQFSINNGKRYYASYYANAGVEFIVKKQLVFFTEPLFYMGLEKISSANKYKYNLGLSGGVRYQF